jgi:amino acid adenylation domain-containing protein
MPTVVDLRGRAGAEPDAPAFRFVGDPAEPTSEPAELDVSISRGELDEAARGIAVALVERGAAGRPVLLLYPPGLDYVAGFLGCLYAGAVAVPAYPPDLARLGRTLPRLRALAADCGAATALSTAGLAALAPALAGTAPELAALDWVATDALPAGTADTWTPPPVDGDSPALLQYTSGSTGTPRGVLLSHANLLHNAELVHTGFGTSRDTVGVSWLPPYHDMGLIGGILQPLYAGFPVVLMSPLTFLRRPLAWLETIARSGATMSGGPNFAFDLCVRKSTAQQRAALDLSRWAVAFCGAEPVRAATLDRFAAAFAPAGFRRAAFYPCYGLAEATLIVTGGQPPRVTGTGQVGSGRPLGGQRLLVVDPATGTGRPPGAEGEIWLAGPSVAQGYWRRPAETAHTFGGRLAGDPRPDRRYLRTGDLGRLDPAGDLVVTGRIKDVIIVRGRNLHPPDLELAVEQAVPPVRPGCAAAFPVVRDGTEQVGVACELAGPPDRSGTGPVVAAVRQAVAEAAEVPVATVVLLRPGRLPKTSSGKIQRYACRQALATGEWEAGAPGVLARWDGADADADGAGSTGGPADRPPAGVVELVAGVLGLPPEQLPAGAPLTGLGLDSLRAIELRAGLRAGPGLDVPLSDLLTGVTTAELVARPPAGPPTREPPGAERPASREPPTGDSGSGEPPATEHPASDGQRALWLIQRSAPASTAYHVSRAARIQSGLDPDALERALRAVVDRHPALRTCLPDRGGVPVQRVVPRSGPVLERHRLPGLAEDALRRRVQADADRPFDLARGPLFRASLYSRADTDHVLLLSLHHAVTDFWSLTVLVDELLAGYQGRRPPATSIMEVQHRPAGDPPPQLHDQHGPGYWRRALAGAPPELALPTSFPRPRVQSFRGATHRLRLDPAGLRRLDEFAAATGVTRFAALAAGFAAVLSRYTGEPEVVFGAPTAGRRDGEQDRLGYFVNPVPLRVRVPAGGSFRELARQVRQVVIEALEHPVPFPRLVEAVRPVRDPGRPPVIQAMLALQRPPAGRPDLGGFAVADESVPVRLGGGLAVRPFRLAETGAAFDLSLSLAEVDGGLTGTVSYCADLFDPPAVARLTGHLTTVLAGAMAEPDRPLAALPLLAAGERAQALAVAEGPAHGYPDGLPLDRLFAQRVAGCPEATAVVAGPHRLSYAELDQRADRLAARLVTGYGVRRGDRVGVFLPRGPDAPVAFWAALKAGGGYLPLAPDLPPARLAWLVTDAAPKVVVTCRRLAGRLPAGGPATVWLDEPAPDQPPPDQPPPDQPGRPGGRAGPGPDDLAYVLYTSGSTGRPKGVMVPHHAAVHTALTLAGGLAITPASRVLQFASCAYDVHVSDLLSAHLSGAELHLPPEEAAVPGPATVALLARERITHVTLSPSVLAALPDADLPALTHILCGGEPCPPEVVSRWGPGREFRNAYGPTETTVCVSWVSCRPDGRRPPIGAPMPNASVHVLDGRMEPVPVGVPGEIYVGGPRVSWGYLGRPGLTAAGFVPDPFRPGTGARLYRTGDRARRLPDGTVDFLGRRDDQLKIRGVRVEPGEVAARLRDLPGVRDAAVVPGAGPAGGAELVAYLVADRDRRPVPELRGLLRAELPEPWLPAAFVYLDALPLNPSGKLDRRALPPPAPADRGRSGRLDPRTELERVIAEVWATVLGHPAVGARDHFFDELGGSSLLVGRVTSELGRRLGRDLPVTLLFEHPTVEALARRLDPAGSPAPPTPAPAAPAPEEQAARRRAALARRTRPAPAPGDRPPPGS